MSKKKEHTMEYYILKSKHQGHFISSKPKSDNNIVFDTGSKIKDKVPLIEFFMDKNSQGELLDQISTALPGLTITQNLKNALDETNVDSVDYYPVIIHNPIKNESHEKIFIANITSLIDCIDKEKSDFETYPGMPDKINEIYSLSLNTDIINKCKMFRMLNHDSLIIINEDVKESLEKHNVTNTDFVSISEFNTDDY